MARDEKGHFTSTAAKIIDGVEYKRCSGQAHDEPEWLPATDKYFYRFKSGERVGRLTPRCRLCANWSKLKSPGLSGKVPVESVRPFFIEAVNRVGMMEFARRSGINDTTIRYIIREHTTYRSVQKQIVRRCMLELISMRRKGEVRHRDSIIHGAKSRGHTEKTVTSRRDLYHPNGEDDNTRRRASTARLTS